MLRIWIGLFDLFQHFGQTVNQRNLAADRFIIAADSKLVLKGKGIGGPPTACKISQSGDFYFALAGLVNDRNRSFFPYETAGKSFWIGDSFDHNLARMDQALSISLAIEMTRLKTEDPDDFAVFHKPGIDTLSIIGGEMVDGAPHMFSRGFQYDDLTETVSISRASCPGDCSNGGMFFLIGETNLSTRMANEFLADTKALHDPIAEVRKIVETEIQTYPEIAGPPITILRVNKTGASWPSNDSGCPVIVTPTHH
jgi:hypothetical protein